jgi:hypothetical protein
MKLTSYVLLMLTATLLFSCKKKKDEDAKLKLLTERTWHITQYQYRELPTDPWDVEDVTEVCELDDVFTFLADGTYTLTEGQTKCDPFDPDLIDSGTWSFQNDQSVLRITSLGETFDFTIEQLDENTLMIMHYDASVPEYFRIVFHH